MRPLVDFVTDKRFLLIIATLAIAALLFLWLAPINVSSSTGTGTALAASGGDILAGSLLILLLSGILVSIVLMLSGADSDSREIARQITSTPAAEALLERWLRRSRFYRFMGGLVAFVLSYLVLDDEDGLTQLLFVLLCGVALGGALAEVHVLRRRRGTTAAADLTVRTVRDFTDPADLIAIAVLGLGATAALMAALFGWSTNTSAAWSVGALASIVTVVAFQYLVARRSRPALRPELRDADDLLRFLAATQGFARPAIAAAFMMLANSLGQDGNTALASLSPVLILAGVVWWYRGRHSRIPELAQRRMAA